MRNSPPDNSRRRETHDLVVDILNMAQRGERKTRIVSKVGISNKQAKNLFASLKRRGYLTEERGIWKTTESGNSIIGTCELCRQIVHPIRTK